MSDVRTMEFEKTRQRTIDTYKNEGEMQDVERRILKDYYRDMQAFRDILQLEFDVAAPFEAQCHLDGNILCTISHQEEDNATGPGYTLFEPYQLVVSW